MTMPNPVAEVVERLPRTSDLLGRTRLDLHECARITMTSEHMETAELLKEAQAEIERLSRERDTGVPEGWRDISAAPRNGTQILVRTKDGSVNIAWWSSSHQAWAYGGGLWGENVVEWFPVPGSSAAPQPPTVSTQGWQPIESAPKGRKILVWAQSGSTGTARTMMARFYDVGTLLVAEGYENEDWAQEVDGDYYMPPDWYEEFEGEEPPAHNITPTHWMPCPAAPGELTAPEPDLLTVTRERDQAREALAWYGEQARLARLIHSEGDPGRHALEADGGKRARSVLHPEKEEKA